MKKCFAVDLSNSRYVVYCSSFLNEICLKIPPKVRPFKHLEDDISYDVVILAVTTKNGLLMKDVIYHFSGHYFAISTRLSDDYIVHMSWDLEGNCDCNRRAAV